MEKAHVQRRIDQLLSSFGVCTRREARGLCRDGRVTDADGSPVMDPAAKLRARDLRVDGSPLPYPDGIFIMLHKPVGVVCSHDSNEGPLVHDLLPPEWRRRDPPVSSIGRLDKDTSGLLLLTDNGSLNHQLAAAKRGIEKTYVATVERDLDADVATAFASGSLLLRGERSPCAPATLRQIDARTAEVTLTEGRYHQVRRMFGACGHHVLTLHRIRFGPYRLAALPVGEWLEVGSGVQADQPVTARIVWCKARGVEGVSKTHARSHPT